MSCKAIPCGLLVLMLVFGCSDAKDKKPALAGDKMVAVLYDLMLIEEYATQHVVKDSTVPVADFRNEKYGEVFNLHKIDPAAFTASYKYYLRHPDEMKVIFDSVQSLSTRKRMDIMHHKERSRDTVKLKEKRKIVQPL